MRLIQKSLFGIGTALMIHSTAFAQASGLTVGFLTDYMQSAGEDLIDTGFDRLDQTIVNAGLELTSAARELRHEYEASLDTTIDALDEAQRTALQNTNSLLDSLDQSVDLNSEKITQSINEITSPLYSILGGKPRIIALKNSNTPWGKTDFDITGKGVALSDIKSVKAFIGGKQIKSEPIQSDDTQLKYRFTPSDWAHLEKPENNVLHVPVKLQITFCSRRWLFCKNRTETYYTEIMQFPKVLGDVTVHYTHEVATTDTNKKCSPPWTSSRVQSKVRLSGIKSRSKTHYPYVIHDEGYSFLTNMEADEKPSYSFNLDHGGCSGSRSRAGWHSIGFQKLQTRSKASSERKVGATCRVTTIVCGYQTKTTDARNNDVLDKVKLSASDTLVIDIPGNKVNFSHIEVNSPLFIDGSKVFLINKTEPIKVEYRPQDQKVFIKR